MQQSDVVDTPVLDTHCDYNVVKVELRDSLFFAQPLDCCEICNVVRTRNAPCHRDAAEKRLQRDQFIHDVKSALHEQNNEELINVLLFDADLEGSLLIEDLKAAIPDPRLHIFSPNLDPAVVARTRVHCDERGTVVCGQGCFHAFLAHWNDFILSSGGLHVVFADVHRSFENGAGLLLTELASRRMFRVRAQAGDVAAVVSFATSLLYQQFCTGSRAVALERVIDRCVDISLSPLSPYNLQIDARRSYGTMVFYHGRVQRKAICAKEIDDFQVRETLVERQSNH